ncbi:hypothetical protein RvY_11012 [Ramazzottius varieornatus]|uniref:BED-type domain-containing protein n=1 Tax=Ramazzottius varieornatus TaxID=947166 RepID=A0A1D1VEQ5_RAMVA|nr:hypothetical protein RvY_11012 [Ramazzottius varieornatus]
MGSRESSWNRTRNNNDDDDPHDDLDDEVAELELNFGHFTKSTGKDGKIAAKCNYCSTTCKNVQGTSDWHYRKKNGHPPKLKDAVESKLIPEAFRAKQKDESQIMSKSETTRYTNNLTEWIVCTAKPIGTVDEPHFVRMINGLNPSYKVPLRAYHEISKTGYNL